VADLGSQAMMVAWTPRQLSSHANSEVSFDVSDLFRGRSALGNAKPFRGRPQLAAELYPQLQICASGGGLQRVSFGVMIQDLAPFFRFLDEMEDAAAGARCAFRSPSAALEVQGHVWSLFTQWLSAEGDRRAHFIYSTCKRLFTMAASTESEQLDAFLLPPNPFRNPQKIRHSRHKLSDETDLSLDSLRAINRALQTQVEGTIGRFQEAERALQGEALKRRAPGATCCWHHRNECIEQVMASITEEIARTGHYPRNISANEICKRAGLIKVVNSGTSEQRDLMRKKLSSFVSGAEGTYKVFLENDSYEWHVWGDALPELHALGRDAGWEVNHWQQGSGTYYKFDRAAPATVAQIVRALHAFVPRKHDLLAALALLLQQTGWNVSTALDLDVRDWWKPHPTHPDLVVKMYAPKGRAGGTLQPAFSLRKKKLKPFDLVTRVLEWTAPLRDSVKHKLAETKRLLASDADNAALLQEEARLDALRSRLWLHLDFHGKITTLEKDDVKWTWINEILKKSGVKLNNDPVVFSQDLTRKSYACFVYETSGYNLVITQVALGHKDFSSLIAYLDRKRIRKRNRRAWFDLQCALLGTLKEGALLRTVLAKQLRDGAVTADEIRRLDERSSRTRQGFLCANPWEPDEHADPGHRSGEICREQRCLSGCSKAFATWDTAQWLALHVLELRRRREQTPVPLWHESDDDVDLGIAEDLLNRFTITNQQAAFRWASERLKRQGYQITLPSSVTMRLAGRSGT
jgi:integrase